MNKAFVGKLVLLLLLITGCTEIGNMQEQPKLHSPYDESDEFGAAARDLDPNAVPVGFLRDDDHFYTGIVDEEFVEDFPMEITEEMLIDGESKYNGFCSPCHGYSGYGDGVLAREGFPPPASFHNEDIRNQPVGHYFDVITNGQLSMFSYAARLEPAERWAVIAYIRAMQLSQFVALEDLPASLQTEFTSVEAADAGDTE